MYPNVLPVPVCAIPTIFLPDITTGKASSCMGVGFEKPRSSIALSSCLLMFNSSNDSIISEAKIAIMARLKCSGEL